MPEPGLSVITGAVSSLPDTYAAFCAQADRRPERAAVRHGTEARTCRELHSAVENLAARLH
ncbi:hypothetical protein AB0N31_03515 [Streptomyces sp. NPDC051051]|uniref:hypothetical protein n=1 Tax=Streptomyces sp. NPDC051051 TaxID=3155666 RepID=UPI003437FB5E